MYQNKYFTNTDNPASKPQTATEGMEARKYSGNPLLREVDEELKRLRSQFDKVAGSSTSGTGTPASYSTSTNNYVSTSPQGSRIGKVEDFQRNNYTVGESVRSGSGFAAPNSGRENYHKDAVRYEASESTPIASGVPQGLSSYGYQQVGSNFGTTFSSQGNTPTVTGGSSTSFVNNTSAYANKISGSSKQANSSFEFKSPKNLTSSGRYQIDPQPQSQPLTQPIAQQQNQLPSQSISQLPSHPQQQTLQSQPIVQNQQAVSQVECEPQNPQVNTVQVHTEPTTFHQQVTLPVVEIFSGQQFKIPSARPQLIRVANPKSQHIRINSPAKIKSGPSPSEIARAQEEAKRIAEMQHIQRERELAKQYQQETTRIRQERDKAAVQRKQREDRESSISKSQLGNYVTNINQRNRKISQLDTKVNQQQYQIIDAENETKRYKAEIQNLKATHKIQLQAANTTISNLKREVDLLNRQKDRRNVELQNKMSKVNFSYQQVSGINNRLNREIEGLKRELEKRSNNNESSQNVFEDFKLKINEKTQRINELQKTIDQLTEQRNGFKRRVDELLLQGYEPKKEFSMQKLERNPGAFDQILKLNLEENNSYKANLSVKEQQIFRLQEVNRTFKGQNERMRNDIEIQKLKRMTELKNIQMTMDIEVQVKQNEIGSLNHVIVALEEKLRFIVQQDRKKDQFMVTYLKGRAESAEEKQSIDQFFKEFELLSVNTNIAECLQREHAEISRLKEQIQKLYMERS